MRSFIQKTRNNDVKFKGVTSENGVTPFFYECHPHFIDSIILSKL